MKKIALLTALLTLVGAHTAQAKSYVWTDPTYGFTMSFPDSWKAQGGLVPEEKLKVLAPVENVQCTFEASEDSRFTIYPRRFDKEILSKEFNWDYWEDVTANYQDRFFYYDKVGSIGRGDARYTVVDYVLEKDGMGKAKRELIYSSIYGDMHFMARCVAARHTYDDFFDTFMQMIGSIDFKPAYSAYNNGYYRNFMGNGYVKPKEPNFLMKILPYKKKRPIYTAQ